MSQGSENSQLNVKKARAGFTLVEVLIAMVVLAVGLLALAQLQVAAINGLAYSRHFSVATQLAEGQMEKLMSYPFSELEAINQTYYPQDKNGNNIVAVTTSGTTESPFYDVMTIGADTITGQPISRGDKKATRLWLPTPVNELGETALPGQNAFLVTWTVERGGNRGTIPNTGRHYGIPGPYSIRLVVTAIWFEKGEALSTKSPHSSLVDSNDNLIAGRRSSITGIRELQAAAQ